MFLRILNKHAPIKSKLFHANHASYISKPPKTYIPLLKKLQKAKKLLQQTLQKREKKTILMS